MATLTYIPCPACPVRLKPLFRQFAPQELAWVTALKEEHLPFRARDHIVRAGYTGGDFYTIFSGWAYRYKTLGNGSRQVLDFLLTGDLVGLQSPLTGCVRHAVCALTDVQLCRLRGEPFRRIFDDQPDLASSLMETLVREEDRADMRLLMLGRQRPSQRLAYLMLELHDRLRRREMADATRCPFPLTYELMGDALGLGRSQVARSLTDLRQRGWITLDEGTLSIHDRQAMARYSGYGGQSEDEERAII